MRLAIMQPYIFPYIGYFQLVNSVDHFVFYDDVTFIKQGWINRNNILLNGRAHLFTIPLQNASSYQLIQDTKISTVSNWSSKFLKTIEQAYKKAPQYLDVFPLIEKTLNREYESIGDLAKMSIRNVSDYLGIKTVFTDTSKIYQNNELSAQNRVLDICQKLKTDNYINPIGGQELYSKEVFKENAIDLFFIKSKPIAYQQYDNEFVPYLSIIDLMMFNEKEQVLSFTNQYELI